MSIKEEVIEMKKELEEVRNESFAMELLKDLKKANKRMFIIWICTFFGLLLSVGYIVYLLNDIGTITENIDVQDVESVDNSDIQIGDR